MTCKEVQGNYVAFIDNELNARQLNSFLHHVEHCDNCREEFAIYYTMIMGMRYLDDDEKSDIHIDFEEKLQAGRELLWKYRLNFIWKVLLLAALCIILIWSVS